MAPALLEHPPSTRARPSNPSSARRLDVQGLRGVAVLLVVVDHLTGRPSGGFLGVDVFFVLSGFLITGLLVAEFERTGRVSPAGFYRRRARRILPASLLVLILTCVAAQFLLIGVRARQTVVDALWSAGFAANWHFAALGTDYFQRELPPSPLQHYWSLAVEEQFYVLWPWLTLLLLVVLVARVRPEARRLVLPVAFGAVVLISFSWGLLDAREQPTAAYFSTASRAWQLAFGALLAVVPATAARWSPWLRVTSSWAGLVVIVASSLWLGPTDAFPAPWGALPVLGAGLVLMAGKGVPGGTTTFALGNPVIRYLGDISFSLYLWHWPVFVFFAAVRPMAGWQDFVFAAVIALTLSVASYHLVEVPFRDRRPTARAGSADPGRRSRSVALVAVLACTTAVVVAGSLVATAPLSGTASNGSPVVDVSVGPRSSDGSSPGTATSSAASMVSIADDDESRAIQSELAQALAAQEWPTLVPGPDDLNAMPADRAEIAACVEGAPKGCRPGDGSAGTVMVVGDSISGRYLVTVRRALGPRGWQVVDGSRSGCELVDTRILPPAAASRLSPDRCADERTKVLDQVREVRPDVVLLANDYDAVGYLESKKSGSAAVEEWSAALGRTVDDLGKDAEVVVLSAPPAGGDLRTCLTKFSGPRACVSTVQASWAQLRDAERAVARSKDAAFVDTSGWYCTATNQCPAFADGMLIRFDRIHQTDAYAERVAAVMVKALDAAKVITS